MINSKEEFKQELDRLTKLNDKNMLNDFGIGKLKIANKLENLILFGVGSSKPIKEEIDFIIYEGKKYVHKTDLETLINNGTYVEVG